MRLTLTPRSKILETLIDTDTLSCCDTYSDDRIVGKGVFLLLALCFNPSAIL